MKKVLSFVLVLAMVLGSFAMAFAKDFTDVTSEEDCLGAVSVLSDLSIISGYPDGTFQPEKVVTRAEMAAFLINALGITPAKTNGTVFPDVPYTHWAAPYVDYAQSLGIIAGYTDGTFKPDKTVTYNEAITMVVKALGYRDEALTGTYPASYVNMAMTLGLLEDVQAGTAGAVRGDIAMLVYAAMDKAMVTISKDGSINYLQEKQADGTFENVTMFNRHGVTFKKGIIDEKMAAKALADVDEYVGDYCSYWVNSNGKIVALEEELSTSYTWTADSDVDEDWGEYIESSDFTAANAKVFRNGELTTTSFSAVTLTDGVEYTIAADFDGVYVDEIYSLSFWEIDATDFIADEEDLEELNDAIEDIDLPFTKNNKAEIDMDSFELEGIDSLSDFAVKDVIETYLGATGKIVKIVVTRDVVTGSVTKINSANDTITVDGKTYEPIGDEFDGDLAVEVGDEYNFYLNAAGDVVAREEVTETAAYAVVVATAAEDATWTDGAAGYSVKLFTAEGKTETYTVKKDVVTTIGTSNWANFIGTVVKYNVNDAGEVSTMKAVEGSALAGNGTVGAKKTLAGKYFTSDAIVVISENAIASATKITPDTDKTFDLTLSSAAKVAGEEYAECLYILKDGKVEFAVMTLTAAADETFGIYAGWAKTVDEDNDEIAELYFYVDGEKVTYTADKSLGGYFTVDGSIGLIELTGDEVTDFNAVTFTATSSAVTSSTSKTAKFKDNVWDGYAVDEEVKVYYVTNSGSISLKDTTKLTASDGYDVYLYDLDDEVFDADNTPDQVYDIIVVVQP